MNQLEGAPKRGAKDRDAAVALMGALRGKDVHLWIEEGQLSYDAPVGALTHDDLDQIRAHKASILELLRAVDAAADAAVDDAAIAIADRRSPLPLSLAQQRLWFLDQLEGARTAYHISGAVALTGALDVAALTATLDAVAARHEALRTVFVVEDGAPVQVIQPPGGFALPVDDLAALTGIAQDVELRRLAAIEAQAPFDLSTGPLVRARLLRLAADRHLLLMTMHHIVSDGWSLGVLGREIAALYAAHLEGRGDPLPPLAIQYGDYAQWQRDALLGPALQQQRAYWVQQLAGAPALLPLPTDRPRPAAQSYAGANAPVALSPALTAGLRALARAHDATLYMVLLTGWAITLVRLAGQDDVVIGAPVANRGRRELEPLIGLFINTLALRVRIADDARVADVIAQVKDMTLAAYAHQALPFERVVEALQPERSLSHSPVFQVLFALQNTPSQATQLPGLTLAPYDMPRATAQLDLTLGLQETDDAVTGDLNYATALFDRATAERWIACFQAVLAAMVQDARAEVARLPMLSAAERRLVVETFNATAAPFPRDRTLHGLIEDQVARTPDAIAIECGGAQLSYAALDARANQVARVLRGRGALVAICVERSLDMIVGLLGILKAGAAYVPLDPGYPAERLAYMLGDAAPAVVLTQQRLAASVAGAHEVIALDGDAFDGVDASPLGVTVDPRDLAYVIYTSGSTGQPKGAMNEHRAVVNRLHWMQQAYRLDARDRVLQKTPFSFDVSVWELFWPLLTGARLVFARPDGHQDPRYLAQLIDEAGITTLHFVPSMLQVFLASLAGPLPTLRHVVCSGEELPLALVQRCADALPGARLHNLYGPTEAAIDVTFWDHEPGRAIHRVPIGQPVANTQIYILDRHDQPVPIGVAGELHIAGVQVGRGYWRRPELTAARFVRDPFARDADAKMYRTGDLARWLGDGTIEYLGRNDHQVKLRGFRIELGEIEARLASHPQIREAVVLAREDVPGDKRLVAYVTHRDAAPTIEALRAHLKATLPDHMVPNAFVVLDRLPITQNGKLDRKALPAPDRRAIEVQTYAAPEGATEQALAEVWQALLGVDRVGRHDNFFALGGHSLLIVTMIERLRQRGIATEVSRVFASPTLAELARALDGAAVDVDPEVPPNRIPPGSAQLTPDMLSLIELDAAQLARVVHSVPGGAPNVQDIYPLAPLQEGLVFHHLLNEQWDTYVMPSLLEVGARATVDALLAALQALIDRHDVFRTAVLWKDLPRAVQVVYRAAPLPVRELALDPALDVLAQLRARMAPERLRMDLSLAPLIRVELAHDPANQRWYLLLLLHHLIDDVTSLTIMMSELAAHLEGRAGDLRPPVPYRNFVARTLARGHDQAERFFRDKLGAIDEPTAPFGLLDLYGDGSRIAEAKLAVDDELARRMRRLAARLGLSTATLFHAAWALVVARTSGRDDVVFGSVLSGRLQGAVDADRALGMFVNTLPLALRLGGLDARQLVDHTQREIVALLAFEHASLALAQRCSGITGGGPLFSAVLNYRHSVRPARTTPVAGSPLADIRMLATQERTNYPLMMSVDDLGDGFVLSAQVDRRVDPARVTAYLHTAVASLIDALEHAPATPAAQLAIVPASERQLLLETFNPPRTAFPEERLMHGLFEDQVARAPDAPAVRCAGEALSYRALDARANQLAHALVARGIGAGARVAICVERSLEMVVGLLGILKAGAAYIPLDPNYPAARLAYMLDDARPAAVLTLARVRDVLPAVDDGIVIALDRDWAAIAARPATPAPSHATARDVAYVIYTSGSTGMPKGVMIEHRNAVNFLHWGRAAFPEAQLRHTLFSTSINFDLSIFELFLPLTVGGLVHLVTSVLELDRAVDDATLVNTVPSAMAMLLDAQRVPSAVQAINLAGEALKRELVERIFAQTGAQWVNNLYGPTETTTYSTHARFDRAGGFRPDVGQPVANTQVYLLDRHGALVPLGVVGEIYIAGAGVARGYLDRPELTAQRFVRDPFAADPDARMYKTGDLGRWLASGNIEYLGRNDHQVKIRGFRIELGEIETRLASYPEVGEAVVIAREDTPGDQRLVAYLTLRDAEAAQPAVQLQVDSWQTIFDQEYVAADDAGDPRDNFSTWIDSYDGLPFGLPAMREWADLAAARIARLPLGDVLELGCGVGLIVFRLLAQCGRYVATDFSPSALATIARHVRAADRARVELLRGDAAAIATQLARDVDTTIINSVIQYFPSASYLREVIAAAIARTRDGGAIFLGDVRNLRLLEVFATALAVHKASPHEAIEIVRQRVRAQVETAGELLVAPELFVALALQLPRVSHLEIVPKITAAHDNELFQYRYDVVLHVGRPRHAAPVVALHWQRDALTVEALGERLARDQPTYLRVAGIGNARLAPALAYVAALAGSATTVAQVRAAPPSHDAPAIAALIAIADARGYDAEPSWIGSGAHGDYSLLLTRRGAERYLTDVAELRAPELDLRAQATDPLRNRRIAELAPAIRAYVKDRLPEHMQPASYVFLDALPRTPNGKLDRAALRPPELAAVAARHYEPPEDKAEELLAMMLQDLLRVSRVGRGDNFFDLGGHSLLATQCVARIREIFQVEFPLRELFAASTVAGIAETLDRLCGSRARIVQLATAFATSGDRSAGAIARRSDAGPRPASYAQRRVWRQAQKPDTGALYHVLTGVRLCGALDRAALGAALDALIARHEILRTTYAWDDDELWQRVGPAQPFALRDVRDVDVDVEEATANEARAPFDLVHGPVIRGALLRIADDEHALIIVQHRISSDGWSKGVFNRELGALYSAHHAGAPSPLPPLEIQYADYASWQRDALPPQALARGVAHWQQQLAGAPLALALPTDRPRPAIQRHAGASHDLVLEPSLTAALRAFARQQDVTLFMVLLAGWALALSRRSGARDLVIGSPMANRPRAELEALIGTFVNAVPLRVRVHDDLAVRGLLQQVKATTLDAYAQQWVPFDAIAAAVAPAPTPDRHPVFQTNFMLLNTPQGAVQLSGLTLLPHEIPLAAAEYELSLNLQERGDAVVGVLIYATALFDRETIAACLADYQAALRALLGDPARVLGDVRLVR